MDFPLSDLYAAMATPCSYTAALGGPASAIRAVLDSRPADVLGGDQLSTRYEVRVQSADVGGQVARGARFELAGVVYQATAAGQPIDDGKELSVPVKVL